MDGKTAVCFVGMNLTNNSHRKEPLGREGYRLYTRRDKSFLKLLRWNQYIKKLPRGEPM